MCSNLYFSFCTFPQAHRSSIHVSPFTSFSSSIPPLYRLITAPYMFLHSLLSHHPSHLYTGSSQLHTYFSIHFILIIHPTSIQAHHSSIHVSPFTSFSSSIPPLHRLITAPYIFLLSFLSHHPSHLYTGSSQLHTYFSFHFFLIIHPTSIQAHHSSTHGSPFISFSSSIPPLHRLITAPYIFLHSFLSHHPSHLYTGSSQLH